MRKRIMSVRWVNFLIFALLPVTNATAQPVVEFEEELDFSGPEAWAMKYFGSLNFLTGFGSPRSIRPGAIDLGL